MLLKKQPGTSNNLQRVSAMQVSPGEDGTFRMGLLTQVELSPDTAISGPGFNDRTVRIRNGEHFYFVFREDLNRAGLVPPEHYVRTAAAS